MICYHYRLGLMGLFFVNITSGTASTVRGVSFGKEKAIHCTRKDNPYDNADNNNDEKLYAHTIKTDFLNKKFLYILC